MFSAFIAAGDPRFPRLRGDRSWALSRKSIGKLNVLVPIFCRLYGLFHIYVIYLWIVSICVSKIIKDYKWLVIYIYIVYYSMIIVLKIIELLDLGPLDLGCKFLQHENQGSRSI